MRSELLICLEKFKGIVIFATNLITNYDYAFETRVKNVNFTMPDSDCRKKIRDIHCLPEIPKAQDLNIIELAEKFEDFCGRDIKNAVVRACVAAVVGKQEYVNQKNLLKPHAKG